MSGPEVKRIKTEVLFSVVKDVLNRGSAACITVTGMSMNPFLRGNIDSVQLNAIDFSKIKTADIVLYHRDNGEYVLHRICKINEDSYYTIGDAEIEVEGPLRPDQLIALVTAVWRGKKKISCDNILWNFLSKGWIIVIPWRLTIKKVYQFVKNNDIKK